VIAGRLLRTRTRRWVALVVAALVVAAVVVAAWPRSGPATIAAQDEKIVVPAGTGLTGTVTLDAGLYLPATTPAPAVIVAHGFGGSRLSVDADAQRLARAGFVVLTYSTRGFGRSTGQVGLDSLDYEVPDARALVDWLAKRSEVTQDGPGDPRVGVTGGSYGGALALMLAGTDPRIDAVAAVATWNNLEQALFPNNTAVVKVGGNPPSPSAPVGTGTPAFIPGGADGVFKQAWAAALISSVLTTPASGPSSVGNSGYDDVPAPTKDGTAGPTAGSTSGASAGCGRLMADICAAYTQVAETGRITPTMATLLAKSSPDQVVSTIKAPTLLVQGEQDTLFGLDQADANARAIAANGTPVAVSWYPGGHNGGAPDTTTENRITDWLHHYLFRTGPAPSQTFRYSVAGPVSDRGQPRLRTLQVPQYPGLAGIAHPPLTPDVTVPLDGRPQVIANPPGGVPAALTSLPGIGSLASSLAALSVVPGQTAEFVSQPMTTPLVVTGSATVTLQIERLPAAGSGSTDATSGPSTGAAGGANKPSSVLYLSLASVPGSAGTASGTAPGTAASASAATGTTSGSVSTFAAAALGGAPAGGAVAPIRLDDLPANGTPALVTVDLPAVAFQVVSGNRLMLRVATTDQGYFGPKTPAAYRVSLAPGGNLTVPEVGGTRVPGGDDAEPVGLAIGLAVLVLVGTAGLITVGRIRPRGRRTAAPPEAPDPSETPRLPAVSPPPVVSQPPERGPATQISPNGAPLAANGTGDEGPIPLVINGLAKQYPGGVAAVQDVSLRVERGQVLGLLGPNGAGKTTTLRMVMGLIMPSAGSISIFGEPAGPGAPILSRIGSFVEGAGFLPHLPGMANLELYWRATGRPAADAHLAEALEIADLGAAVRRKVKTYSHGMRQRLAIAQAMLGLPDLLILDEPTNGLDPPQIHAMREVLRRYAASGRTVLVSSHLLSEVEQTCTHVVVMSRGRTIAAGTVAEMVAASGEMSIGTPTPDAAMDCLRGIDGIGAVEPSGSGVAVDLGGVPLGEALGRLLGAGVVVTSAAPRNRLEDVFLELVGSATPVVGATASRAGSGARKAARNGTGTGTGSGGAAR